MKSTCETHSHTAANDIDDIRIRSGPKSDSKIYTKEYLWSCEIANSLIYCLGFTYALISVWAHWFCHKGICHTTILITCFYRPQPQGNRAQCRMHIAQIILWINYIIRCRSLVSLAFDQRSVYCFHTQNECIFIIEKHKKKHENDANPFGKYIVLILHPIVNVLQGQLHVDSVFSEWLWFVLWWRDSLKAAEGIYMSQPLIVIMLSQCGCVQHCDMNNEIKVTERVKRCIVCRGNQYMHWVLTAESPRIALHFFPFNSVFNIKIQIAMIRCHFICFNGICVIAIVMHLKRPAQYVRSQMKMKFMMFFSHHSNAFPFPGFVDFVWHFTMISM